MQCAKCKSEINDKNQRFCSRCGTEISPAENAEIKEDNSSSFFKISPFKLVVYSVTTLWLYEFYWFYKNWTALRKADPKSFHPIIGAIFFPISAYSLFKKVFNSTKLQGHEGSYPASILAATFFVLTYIGGQLWSEELMIYGRSWWLMLLIVYTSQSLILGYVQKNINHTLE